MILQVTLSDPFHLRRDWTTPLFLPLHPARFLSYEHTLSCIAQGKILRLDYTVSEEQLVRPLDGGFLRCLPG